MPSAVRLGILPLVVCPLLLGAVALAGPLFGLDFGLGALGTLSDARAQNDQLDRCNRAARDRLKRKQAVTEEVLDRQTTLLQGAAAFRRIDEDTEAEIAGTEPRRNDAPPDRDMCLTVLLWVRAELANAPNSSVLTELEAEFVRLFKQAPNYQNPAPRAAEAATTGA
jgi:hypothetical protein